MPDCSRAVIFCYLCSFPVQHIGNASQERVENNSGGN